MMGEKEKYMRRCLELAALGRGETSPNPMVGAVIVANGRVIGEGYHHRCGEAHAEVNAVASVQEEDLPLLSQASIYVNLEPCSHYGKTPPCAEMLIRKGIRRVVVGGLDPFPEVAGRGVKMLREAGIEVEVGVCEKECEALNKRFLTFQREHRPYVLLKWAQSVDGFMGKSNERVVFSTEKTLPLVYKMRSEEDAVLIGTNTALVDNPSLTSHGEGKNPVRMVIDRGLRIPRDFKMYDGEARTIVFTERAGEHSDKVEYVQLDFAGDVLRQILDFCYAQQIQSLLVEGGATLLQHCIDNGIGDAVRVEINPMRLGSGVAIPKVDIRVNQRDLLDGNEIIWGEVVR